MPTSPWKKSMAADALLSGLRSKSSGSFVVQTGFPTSLADLIVKNHGRLKKSSRNTKKKHQPSSDVLQFSATQSCSIPPVIENPRSAHRSKDSISGFRFLVVILILLVVLVIGNKKLVLGFTISAFVLVIFENCGIRGWMLLKPCPEARKRLDSVIGSFDLGGRECASPIREIGAGLRSDCLDSDLKWEESRIKDKSSDLFPEICDPKKVCKKRKLGFSGDSKAKKLLRKFLPRRFRGGKSVGRIDHSVEATEEELCERKLLKKEEEEEEEEEEEDNRFKNCFDVLGEGEDTNISMDENKLGRICEFFLFLIVLCGLLRGKAFALFLAIAWCFLYKFIIVVWSRRKMR